MKCYALIAIVVIVIGVKKSEEQDSIYIIHSYKDGPKEKSFRNDKYMRKMESRKLANHHYYMQRHKPAMKSDFWQELEEDLVPSTIQPTNVPKDLSTRSAINKLTKHPTRFTKGIFSHLHTSKHNFKRHSDYIHRHDRNKTRSIKDLNRRHRLTISDLQANLSDSQLAVDSNDPIDVFDFGIDLPKEPLYQSENYSVPRTGSIRTRSAKNHSLEKKYSITDEIFQSAEVEKEKEKEKKAFKKEKEKEIFSHAAHLEKRRSNITNILSPKRTLSSQPSSPSSSSSSSSRNNRYQRRRSDSTSEIIIQKTDSWPRKTTVQEDKHKSNTTHKNEDDNYPSTTVRSTSRRRGLKKPIVNASQKLIDDFYAKLNSELTPPKEETVQAATALPNYPTTEREDNIRYQNEDRVGSIVEIVDMQPVDEKHLQQIDENVAVSKTKPLEEEVTSKPHTKPRHIRKKPSAHHDEDKEDLKDAYSTLNYPKGSLIQASQSNQKEKQEEKPHHRHRSRKRKPERKESTEDTPTPTRAINYQEDEIEEFSKKHVVDLHVHRKQKAPAHEHDHKLKYDDKPSHHVDKKLEINQTPEQEPSRHYKSTDVDPHQHRSQYRLRKKKPTQSIDLLEEKTVPSIQPKKDLIDHLTETPKHKSHHHHNRELNEVESFVKNFEKELQSVRHKLSKQSTAQQREEEEVETTTYKTRSRHRSDSKKNQPEIEHRQLSDFENDKFDLNGFKPSKQYPIVLEVQKPSPTTHPSDDELRPKQPDVDYFVNFFKYQQQHEQQEEQQTEKSHQKNETKHVVKSRKLKPPTTHQRSKQLHLETENDQQIELTPKPTMLPKSTSQPVEETTHKRRKHGRQKVSEIQIDAKTRRLNALKHPINENQPHPLQETEGPQFGIDLFSGLNLEESKLLKALNENLQPLSSAKGNQHHSKQSNLDYVHKNRFDKDNDDLRQSIADNFFTVPNISRFTHSGASQHLINNDQLKSFDLKDLVYQQGFDQESKRGDKHKRKQHDRDDRKSVEEELQQRLKGGENDAFKGVYTKLQEAADNVQELVNRVHSNRLSNTQSNTPSNSPSKPPEIVHQETIDGFLPIKQKDRNQDSTITKKQRVNQQENYRGGNYHKQNLQHQSNDQLNDKYQDQINEYLNNQQNDFDNKKRQQETYQKHNYEQQLKEHKVNQQNNYEHQLQEQKSNQEQIDLLEGLQRQVNNQNDLQQNIHNKLQQQLNQLQSTTKQNDQYKLQEQIDQYHQELNQYQNQQNSIDEQQVNRAQNRTKPNRLNLKTTVFQNGKKTAQEVLDINLFTNLPSQKQSTPLPEIVSIQSTELNKVPQIFAVDFFGKSFPADQQAITQKNSDPNSHQQILRQQQDVDQAYLQQYGLQVNRLNKQTEGSTQQQNDQTQDAIYKIITQSPQPVKQILKPTLSSIYASTKPTNFQQNQPSQQTAFNENFYHDLIYNLNDPSLRHNRTFQDLINSLQLVPVQNQEHHVQKELQTISKQAEADLYAKLLGLNDAGQLKMQTTPSTKVVHSTENQLKYHSDQPRPQTQIDQKQIEELVKTAFPTAKTSNRHQDIHQQYNLMGKVPTLPTEIYDLRKEPGDQLTYLQQFGKFNLDAIKQNHKTNAFVVDSNGWTPLKSPEPKTKHTKNDEMLMPLYNTLKELGNDIKLSDLDLLQTWLNENILKGHEERMNSKKPEILTKVLPLANLTNINLITGRNTTQIIPVDLSKYARTTPSEAPPKGEMDEDYRRFINQPYWNNDNMMLRNFLKAEYGDHSIGERFGQEYAGFYNGEAWNEAARPVKTVKDYMSKAKPKKNKEKKQKSDDTTISRRVDNNFEQINLESLIQTYPLYTKLGLSNNPSSGFYMQHQITDQNRRSSNAFASRNSPPKKGYMVQEVLDHR